MDFWRVLDRLQPATQTVSDDARSRVARQQQAEQARMTQLETHPQTGEPLLWFTITLSSFGGQPEVPIKWQAVDEDDARESFIEWLAEKEFQTVDFVNDGKKVRLTGRGSWVAGFTMDGKGRTRP